MTTTILDEVKQIFINKGLKEISVKNNTATIKVIFDNVSSNKEGLLFFRDKAKIMRFINTRENPNTRHSYIKAILSLLNDNKKLRVPYLFFRKELSKTTEKIVEKVDKNEFSDREKEKIVSWETLISIKPTRLDHKIYMSFIKNDNIFLRLKIFTIKLKKFDKKTDNYIIGDKLVMNDFKNVKSLGQQTFTLSKETMELVSLLGEENDLFNIGGDQSTRSKLIKNMFNKFLDKPIGDVLIRKIYITSVLKTNPTNEDIKIKARKMLNTFEMWMTNYRKIE